MSAKLTSPRDLFLQLLSEMLWIERMLAFEALPNLRTEAQSESLAAAIDEHLAQTHEHVARVEEAFHSVGAEAASARSAPAAALLQEHEEVSQKIAEPRLSDVYHAGAAIQSEHLELARYELLLELARELGREDVESTLERNRADEEETLLRLRALVARLRGELSA